ncbi:MAG: hypothetical protein H0T55_02600 [Rubrobacteraceae bacterium]|nr:hypothetical protein [Rubrobacteraceae bacterium]
MSISALLGSGLRSFCSLRRIAPRIVYHGAWGGIMEPLSGGDLLRC